MSDPDTLEEDKEAKEIGSSKMNMQNGNFSFQQRQQPTDQSVDEDEKLNETMNSDYPNNFAEEFRLKQQRMFEEFNEVRNEKKKLNNLIKGLSVKDPDEVGAIDGRIDNVNGSPQSTAINMVVETPSSLANDSQLYQLIAQMQQIKDVEDSDDEAAMHPEKRAEEVLTDTNNYKDIGEQELIAKEKSRE